MSFVPVNSTEAFPVPTTPLGQKARNLTDVQFNPQQDAIARALGVTNQNLNTEVQAQQNFAQQVDPRIQGAYGALNQQLTDNLGRVKELYSGASQTVGQGYDFASQQAQSSTDEILSRLSSSADALGQGQATQAASNPILDALGLQKSMLAGSKAGAVGNLQSLGANMQAIGQQGISDAAAEGTQTRSDVQRAALDAITKLQLGAQGETNDLMGQLMSILTNRGLSERNTLQQLEENDAASKADAQQQQFDNMIKMMGMQPDPVDPLDQLNKQLSIEGKQLDNASKLQKSLTGGVGDAGTYAKGTGLEGLQAWFNANLKGSSGHQKKDYGYFKGGVTRLIDQMETQASQLAAKGTKNKNAKIPTGYDLAREEIVNQSKNPEIAAALKAAKLDPSKYYLFMTTDAKGKQVVKPFPQSQILSAIKTYFGKGGSATSTTGKPLA